MGEQLIKKNMDFIKILPSWAQELSYKYLSKTANLYILHGNIRDFLPHQLYEGEFIFNRIQEYIAEVLFGGRDIIAYYDRSGGVNFHSLEMRTEYLAEMRKAFPGIPQEEFFSRSPLKAFSYLEHYFLANLPQSKRIVLLVDYAETLVPLGTMTELSEEDRTVLVTLGRWSHDPIFTQGDVSILLLTENLADLMPRLATSPSTVKVGIPFPDQEVRQLFLEFLDRQEKLLLENRMTPLLAARVTSGLNLLNLNQIAAESFQEDKPLGLEELKRRKKEIIENESGGLLEFIESPWDLSYVAGHDFVKKRFRSAAKAVKQGLLDVLPMGYLITGPVGTGKSFLVSAFTGELGIPMVRFRYMQSRWQGMTESNLERILNLLTALAPVGVMVDEADAFFRPRSEEDGAGARMAGRLAAFMGDTRYRGQVIWFLISARPDLIPIDLKRQGRAEEHLALFYPDTPEEKEEIFQALVRKLDLKIRDFSLSDVLKKFKQEFSGADLEAILIRSRFLAAQTGRTFITREDLEATIADFVPPAYPHEIELQNLVAVLECTSREQVPRKFQNMDRSRLIQEIKELKTLLGERIS